MVLNECKPMDIIKCKLMQYTLKCDGIHWFYSETFGNMYLSETFFM